MVDFARVSPKASSKKTKRSPSPQGRARLSVGPGDAWPFTEARELADQGHLRLGHLIAFFLPSKFERHLESARAVLELWLEVVPPEALTWALVGADAEDAQPFAPRTLTRCRAQLTARSAANSAAFQLGGPEPELSSYELDLDGAAYDDDEVQRGTRSSVRMWLPWPTPISRVVELAQRTAELLSYDSGLVTPAIRFDDDSRAVATRVLARYPGVALEPSGDELGDRCHGAHWMVFLGPRLAQAASLEPLTPTPAGAGVCLRASATPELGDLLTGARPSGLHAMAALLAPITAPAPQRAREAGPRSSLELHEGRGTAVERFEQELRTRWSERFREDGTRLRELAADLARLRDVEAAALTAFEHDLDPFLRALDTIPFVSKTLSIRALPLVASLVEHDRIEDAGRLVSRLGASTLLEHASRDTNVRLLLEASPRGRAVEWLLMHLPPAERAQPLASLGPALIEADPSLAPLVVAALPDDADADDRERLLRGLNNHLGGLYTANLEQAERLADDLQSLARYKPGLCLWFATIYLKRNRADDAMTQLEQAFRHGYRDLARIKGDADFAPLFELPRFKALG